MENIRLTPTFYTLTSARVGGFPADDARVGFDWTATETLGFWLDAWFSASPPTTGCVAARPMWAGFRSAGLFGR
jgi:hypothetical protein